MVKAFILFFFFAIFCGFPAEAAPRLSLVFEPPASEVYIGQEAYFQISLLDRIGVQEISVEPAEWPNADVFLLEKASGQTVSEDGASYALNTLFLSLVPKSAGKMTFPPFCLLVTAPTLISIRDLPENVKGTADGRIEICSPPFSLDVKGLPAYSQKLFAASDVKLFDGVSPKVASVSQGTPVKRSVLLAVTGTLPAFLPDIQADKIQNGRIYNGKTERTSSFSRKGISSALRQTFVIIPKQAGELVLPEIKVPWLNTNTGRIETATVPAYPLTVLPSSGAVDDGRKDGVLSEENVATEESDPLRIVLPSFYALLLTVFLVAFSVERRKRRIRRNRLIEAVRDACLKNDFERVSAAILMWAADSFPDKKFVNLADVRSVFQNKSEAFVEKLEELEFYLYGTGRFARHIPSAKEVLGRELCDAFLRAAQLKIKKQRAEKKHLPGLYPDENDFRKK